MTPQQLHRAVWTVRAEIGHVWKTPPPLDCLRYAFTEAGEAMDAWLRPPRPGDARNNERDNRVLYELGDCAIMLASTARVVPAGAWVDFWQSTGVTLDAIACFVGGMLNYTGNSPDYVAVYGLQLIYAYPGFTTDVALARLEQIRAKYSSSETTGQPATWQDCKTMSQIERYTQMYCSAISDAWSQMLKDGDFTVQDFIDEARCYL
jgi:hypothetical protein